MHNSASRHAQQVLTVAQGRGQLAGPASDSSVARSWLRCLQQHHLDPAQNMPPAVIEHARMLERREQLQQVLEISSNEMNSLHRQLAGSGHAVLLTDARGVILNCVTEQAQKRAFEQAGLWLGADWSEACEGTNGIGTCLVERQPLTIHQDEHFRSRHTGLTCSASPVFDPHGELLAVLDVSSAQHDVSRQSQFHTMALVNLSAKAIESCHFLRSYETEWLLRFHAQAIDVRVISASHRDLQARVASGEFRQDLFYRLNGLVIELPALRERSDKPALLDFLLAEEARGQAVRLSATAREALLAYAWPGNVRQLRNVLRSLCALCEHGVIHSAELPVEIRHAPPPAIPQATHKADQLGDAERQAILAELEAQHWQMSRTAEQLGLSRNTLYRKLRKHGLARPG